MNGEHLYIFRIVLVWFVTSYDLLIVVEESGTHSAPLSFYSKVGENSFERSVPIYQNTRCHNPEGYSVSYHQRENLQTPELCVYQSIHLSISKYFFSSNPAAHLSRITQTLHCFERHELTSLYNIWSPTYVESSVYIA